MIRRILHFEILNDQKLQILNYFKSLNFDLLKTKNFASEKAKQQLIASNNVYFILNTHNFEVNHNLLAETQTVDDDLFNTLSIIKKFNSKLRQFLTSVFHARRIH